MYIFMEVLFPVKAMTNLISDLRHLRNIIHVYVLVKQYAATVTQPMRNGDHNASTRHQLNLLMRQPP